LLPVRGNIVQFRSLALLFLSLFVQLLSQLRPKKANLLLPFAYWGQHGAENLLSCGCKVVALWFSDWSSEPREMFHEARIGSSAERRYMGVL
jgi:hypothetical protein